MRPLICIINPLSGGRRGVGMAAQLAKQPRIAVHVLQQIDLYGIAERAAGDGAALVVCGGDGTAAAVADAAWRVGMRTGVMPPIGIIPLGTGNDLARSLGWHLPHTSLEQTVTLLRTAEAMNIDRWRITGPGGACSCFNYWSIGVDARIASRFHRLRSIHPLFFTSAIGNKMLYAGLGLQQVGDHLAGRVIVAGVPLPAWMATLVLTNIASYAGGARLSSAIRPDDGRVDLLALGPGVALGLAASGMRRPRHIRALDQASVHIPHATMMQIDGEPCRARPGTYAIQREGTVAMLAHPRVMLSSGLASVPGRVAGGLTDARHVAAAAEHSALM